ncbi:hypothetical protein HK102_013688 [Quaeritorhiza haematococci]|nr:hypothetical protein HK102_013688 [Quaeritorhiza haematococci]
MSQYDENTMMSDYCLLENVFRQADNATRHNENIKQQQKQKSFQRQTLVKQARYRSTFLKVMANGMRRREMNRTNYHQKSKTMFWTVEWVFPVMKEGKVEKLSCVEHRVRESTTLSDLLIHLLSADTRTETPRHQTDQPVDQSLPLFRFQLKQHNIDNSSASTLQAFLKKEDAPANSPTFFKLDMSATLRKSLERKTIIEFPVIYVCKGDEELQNVAGDAAAGGDAQVTILQPDVGGNNAGRDIFVDLVKDGEAGNGVDATMVDAAKVEEKTSGSGKESVLPAGIPGGADEVEEGEVNEDEHIFGDQSTESAEIPLDLNQVLSVLVSDLAQTQT